MSTDTLNHPPKSADVGLGPDHHPAGADRPAVAAYETPASTAGTARSAEPGITDLLKELRDESVHLFRQEINLAKTEVGEKASFFAAEGGKAAAGGAVLAIGAIGLLIALSFILGGLIDWVIPHLNASAANGLGFLVTSIPAAIIGYSLYKKAVNNMKREPLTPERTIASLKDDKQWAADRVGGTASSVKHKVTG